MRKIRTVVAMLLTKLALSRDITASKMTPEQMAESQKMARECQARDFKGC